MSHIHSSALAWDYDREPSITLELVLAVCQALPRPLATVVTAMATEGALATALVTAESALAALRSSSPIGLPTSAPIP